MKNGVLKWGMIGCGNIANSLAMAIGSLIDHQLIAVAARDLVRAKVFAEKYNVPLAYGSYTEMLENPDVDVVYISTLHHLHREHALLALKHGKHVLCEKPLGINPAETFDMIEMAKRTGLFFMEAMWTRFLPTMKVVRELVSSGKVGEVKSLSANFGYVATTGDLGRHLNPELSGGALLDVGIYPLAFAQMVLGCDLNLLSSKMTMTPAGVDGTTSFVLSDNYGRVATLDCSVICKTNQSAEIVCDNATIQLPEFWHGTDVVVNFKDGTEDCYHIDYEPNGYVYEVQHVKECMDNRLVQSEIMPHAHTLKLAEIMAKIRFKHGFYYPFEVTK